MILICFQAVLKFELFSFLKQYIDTEISCNIFYNIEYFSLTIWIYDNVL